METDTTPLVHPAEAGAPDLALGHRQPRTVRRAFFWILPWWIALPLAAGLLYESSFEARFAPLREQRIAAVDAEVTHLQRTRETVRQDTHFLVARTAKMIADVAPGDPRGNSRVAQLLADVGLARSRYAQLRWLDQDGRERVRVDFRDGQPQHASTAALQDKAARPYMVAARGLQPGEILLTRVELNVEHGRIEDPPRPTFRALTPITVADRGLAGYLALNFDARELFAPDIMDPKLHVAVLDHEGYWIRGEHHADEWGFMYGDYDRSAPARHPEAWGRIRNDLNGRGSFTDDDGVWFFRRAGPAPAQSTLEPTWYVVARIPGTELRALQLEVGLPLLVATLGTLAALTFLSARLAFAADARDRANEALRRQTIALDRTNLELEQRLAQLKATQDELVQREKLSSLGLMVAGVAHELNTPIGAALLAAGTTESARQSFEERVRTGLKRSDLALHLERERAGLQLVLSNLERASGLVKQFKQVASDRASAERRHFALAEVVSDVAALFRNPLRHRAITLEVEIAPGIAMTSYPGPIGQVVQNLVENAIVHAFDETGRGCIAITAHGEGEDVLLTVSDDGSGIPAEIRDRIFDPFFTTRRNRGGTGLGLHIVHHLVTNVLHGRIAVAPNTPSGTRVTVTLPREAPPAASQ